MANDEDLGSQLYWSCRVADCIRVCENEDEGIKVGNSTSYRITSFYREATAGVPDN